MEFYGPLKESFMKLDAVILLVFQGKKALGFKNSSRTALKCYKVATR